MNLRVIGRGRAVALLVAAVAYLVANIAASASSSRPTQSADPRVIEVLVKRYAFEPSEIEVTAGERVRLLVKSADGPHGVDIKKFKVSKEIPRGTQPVEIEFTPTEAGRFPILCSVFCGEGHDEMKGTLVVTARTAQP